MTSLGTVTPTEDSGFNPIPPGKYLAEIIDHSQPTDAQSGNGQWVKVTWKIVDGDYAGRQIFQTINFRHSNRQTEEIAMKELGQIAFACGHNGVNFDLAEVHNIPCLLIVRIRTDPNGYYEPQNDIRRIEKVPSEAGQGPSAPTPRASNPGNNGNSAPWRS